MSAAPKRLSSLSVLGGALRGAKVDVDVVDEVLIGSDPGCSFHLDLPGISPIHARLWVDLNGAVVHDTRSRAAFRSSAVSWRGTPTIIPAQGSRPRTTWPNRPWKRRLPPATPRRG